MSQRPSMHGVGAMSTRYGMFMGTGAANTNMHHLEVKRAMQAKTMIERIKAMTAAAAEAMDEDDEGEALSQLMSGFSSFKSAFVGGSGKKSPKRRNSIGDTGSVGGISIDGSGTGSGTKTGASFTTDESDSVSCQAVRNRRRCPSVGATFGVSPNLDPPTTRALPHPPSPHHRTLSLPQGSLSMEMDGSGSGGRVRHQTSDAPSFASQDSDLGLGRAESFAEPSSILGGSAGDAYDGLKRSFGGFNHNEPPSVMASTDPSVMASTESVSSSSAGRKDPLESYVPPPPPPPTTTRLPRPPILSEPHRPAPSLPHAPVF